MKISQRLRECLWQVNLSPLRLLRDYGYRQFFIIQSRKKITEKVATYLFAVFPDKISSVIESLVRINSVSVR